MQTLWQDLKYALRMLAKNPGITAAAVLALALGIGANTAIFGIVRAVLLRPLEYREPDRLVTILHPRSSPVSPANFLDWQRESRSFSGMAAAEGWFANLTGRERPEQILGLHLTEGMFDLLGVPAFAGRTFAPEDFGGGKEHVVVLSHALWQRRFGGDRHLVGQSVLLDGERYDVIGVMPPQFQFAPFWITQAEMWAPLRLANRSADRGGQSLRVFARLKQGISRAQAQAEMDTICSRLAAAFPDTNAGMTAQVEPLQEKVVGKIRPALLVLSGAVGFVLLIACANVANLSLARAASRQKEIGIRLALGAKRFRIARQLLTESVLLSLMGGILGLLLAVWGIDWLKHLVEPETGSFANKMPRWREIGIDRTVLAFTLAISVITGIVFGLFPALQASKPDLSDSLKEGGRASSEDGRGRRARNALLVAETAIALVVLIGAGLMLRSFARLRGIEPGFDTRNLLTLTVSVAGQPQYTGLRREALYRRVASQIEALPGVRAVGMINHLPLGGDIWGNNIAIEGRPIPRPGEKINATYRVSCPGYLGAMGIRLLAGRDFTDHDSADAPGVVIINETLARRYWPHENPVGKRLTRDDARNHPAWLTVVGVIRDVRQFEWAGDPGNEFYIPLLQDKFFLTSPHPWASYMTLVVRTASDPLLLTHAVENAVWSAEKNLPISHLQGMDQVLSNSIWQPRFNLLLIGLFAGVALILAAVGIYAVMAYSVTQRTHEIGIRMALGAQRRSVIRMVISQSLLPVTAGLAVGTTAAMALTRVMKTLLYGISATDPFTFAAAPALLLAVAALAALAPARRATEVDPIIALRHE